MDRFKDKNHWKTEHEIGQNLDEDQLLNLKFSGEDLHENQLEGKRDGAEDGQKIPPVKSLPLRWSEKK